MRKNHSSLLVLEFIFGLLFFTFAAAICLQFFVRSYQIDRNAKALNQAIYQCQNLAECFDHIDGDLSALKQLYQDENALTHSSTESLSVVTRSSSSIILLLFDKNAELIYPNSESIVKESDVCYFTTLHCEESAPSNSVGTMLSADITFSDCDGTIIYSLSVEDYLPMKGILR